MYAQGLTCVPKKPSGNLIRHIGLIVCFFLDMFQFHSEPFLRVATFQVVTDWQGTQQKLSLKSRANCFGTESLPVPSELRVDFDSVRTKLKAKSNSKLHLNVSTYELN